MGSLFPLLSASWLLYPNSFSDSFRQRYQVKPVAAHKFSFVEWFAPVDWLHSTKTMSTARPKAQVFGGMDVCARRSLAIHAPHTLVWSEVDESHLKQTAVHWLPKVFEKYSGTISWHFTYTLLTCWPCWPGFQMVSVLTSSNCLIQDAQRGIHRNRC